MRVRSVRNIVTKVHEQRGVGMNTEGGADREGNYRDEDSSPFGSEPANFKIFFLP